MATKWGIISAGRIASDFVSAVQLLPAEEHQFVAIGARKLEDAKEFASKFNISKAYGSYKEVVNDPEVDVVYISCIHPYHAEMSLLALHAGKHVLCEKPMTMNVRQAQEVLVAAKENKRFFMEAIWSRHFPVYYKLRETMEKGTIGEPQVIQVSFGAAIKHVDRILRKELGGGGLLDLGVYTVQMVELVFGGKPEKVTATGSLLPTGVDDTSVITLQYPGNRTAVMTISASTELNNTAIIYGTNGMIKIPDFWCPNEITVKDEKLSFALPATDEKFNFNHSSGLLYQAKEVRQRIQNGDLESKLMSHDSSLSIMTILDEARRQIGVEYDADKQ